MDITWIYGAVAIGGIIMTAINGERYRRKYNKLQGDYDKRCKELTSALGEIGELKNLYEDAKSEMKALNDAIANHKAVEFNGRNNLTWIEEIPSAANREFVCHASVIVIGQDKKSGFYFVVKAFRYQLNDPSDRDFAIRQAEELIETIQNF